MESIINSFNKGLNKDYNIVLQPDGTYVHMANCSLISQDNNNYVVKDCLGNVRMFTINPPYVTNEANIGVLPTPICFISFPDKLIILSTNDQGDGGYGEIGRIDFIPYGEGIQPKAVAGQYNSGYIPLYHSVDLNFTQQHRAEGFAYVENELIERIYWTDNYNEPRTFNVSDPVYINYISSGSLSPIVGESYMVLEGVVNYNGIKYGPGLPAGNVFTTIGAITTYSNVTGTSPTPKVIKNVSANLLDFTPSRALGSIIFDELGAGSLYCGNKVYFYRLGSNTGVNTTWSYGSSPIPVGTQNAPYNVTGVPYHNFTGGGTDNSLVNSGLSVILTINNIDQSFDYIELACAEFDQSADIPRIISVVNKLNITGSTMSIVHDGSINLGILTLGDITLFPASILRAKTISTNKNFMLAGNLTERKELDISFPGGIEPDIVFYPMNVHKESINQVNSCAFGGMIYSGVSPLSETNPAAGTIAPYSRWVVTAGTVTYNGTAYTVGKTIVGVTGAGNDSLTFGSGAQARPCVFKNRYTKFGGGDVKDVIELKGDDCFWDFKSAAAHHHMAGYWGSETYRFGILFYDLKGNPYYVKHLSDRQIPRAADFLTTKDVIGTGPNYMHSVINKLVKFSGIIIPPEIMNQISGFSIVRVERDARIITQGLVSQCTDNGGTPKIFQPAAFIPPSLSLYGLSYAQYVYLSPDLLCDAPLRGSVGVIGDSMTGAAWIDPIIYNVVRSRTYGGTQQIGAKMLNQLPDDFFGTNNRTKKITYWGDVNEGKNLFDIDSAGTGDFNNFISTAAAGVTSSNECIGGGYSTLNACNAIGCKKSFFVLEEDFPNYSQTTVGNGYTANSLANQSQKILMNYTKSSGTAPYGGSGDASLANSLYMSTGHFQPITAQVKLDVFDGTNYVFNNVEVAGGDCFVGLVDIGYGLYDSGFDLPFSSAWTFPCESNSNYALRRGRKTSNVEMFYPGTPKTQSIVMLGPSAEIRLESYQYNKGYSSNTLVKYPALPVNFINSGEFHARIRFAGQKFAGEYNDSFRIFRLLDFKDLSAQNGRINNIKVKEDKVVVWQDLSVNTVPILERQVVSGTSGDQTTIGTGGVVDRFDIISSYFGNQHQWGVIETEYGFAWFDMHRKGFVTLGFDGTGLAEVSLVKGLQGFFSESFLEVIGSNYSDTYSLLNSQDFSESSDRPLMGVGIIGVYDPKNKMTYMTFKFSGRKLLGGLTESTLAKDFTIGYLHNNLDKMFVGFYDWLPSIAHNHNQWVFSCNNPKNTTQYITANNNGITFNVGETLAGTDRSEYINKLTALISGTAKLPNGVEGATYWTKINSTNEIWAHNQPALLGQVTAPDYKYNSFFGRVVNNIITWVVAPNKYGDQEFYVPCVEDMSPTDQNYTDITIESNGQVASDLNVRSTDRNYRRQYKSKQTHNLPLNPTTGRVFGLYLKVTYTKKNWTGNAPTVITTLVKILSSVKSFLTFKR